MTDDDYEEFKKYVTNGFGKFISREKINEKLNAWKNEKLNIGIIGETKSGKSNLINVMRGIFATDPGAAKIKVSQETNFPKPYSDAKYPNITFWDTPGYNGIKSATTAPSYMLDIDKFIKNLSFIPRNGKQEFENETKLKYEEIEQPIQYDCFIICYKDTFHENDLKIARQIRGRGHHFFLVRTQMDKAVEDQEGILGRTLTEQDKKDLIKEIRDNANKCLVVESLPKDVDDDRYIFLVSALLRKVDDKTIDNRNKFDFERLQFEIQNKLKGEKKTLFIYSLFNSCEQNIKLKCQSLRSKIKWAALSGSVGGAIPVPGVSAVVDGGILLTHCLFYMQTLGIFESDFKKTAESFRVNYSALKKNVLDKNSLVRAILELSKAWGAIVLFEDFIKIALKEGSKHLTRILVEYLAKQTILNSAEEVLKSVLLFFPGIGTVIASIVGAGISFGTTSYSLNVLLDCFENVLLEIIKYCKDKSN